jgi:hypothetical protein
MLLGSAPCATAAEAAKDGPKFETLLFVVVIALPWLYAVNKWRRFKYGFRQGAASGREFFGALGWTLVAALWTVAVFWVGGSYYFDKK